ncbi:MAG: hypothetical protein LBI19_08575 [Oscillospiraceae bacterium]|nr:hypothetical protein [Oscillospiraceae bacterium]
MIQKKSVIGAAAFFVLMALTVGWFALAADIGGKENPLVTLEYLKSLDPQIEATIEAAVNEKVDARMQEFNDLLSQASEAIGNMPSGGGGIDINDLLNDDALISRIATEISAQIGAGVGSLEAFALRQEVQTGQTLHLPVGSMVMLRLGSGTVVASNSPGLIDLTTANPLDNGGVLVANHLYTVTMEAGRDIKCTAKMTVFIWGPFTIS